MVQDLNATLRLARTVVFSIASVFAFIVLALSASITHITSSNYYGGYYTFAALGIATAILTLLTLPPMLFLSLNRQGAVTSMIAVEVGWTWFLWIMWLSVGGNSAGFSWICDLYGSDVSMCDQVRAITAFGFLTWLLLLFYNITVFSFVIRQHMRGNTRVWNGYITEVDFNAGGPNSTYPKAGEFAPGVVAPGYPVQQQYPVQPQYPVQQVPAPQQTPSPYPQV